MTLLTRRAEKDLAELPTALAAKARSLISQLDANPTLGQKLIGKLEGKRSARLGRSHRIIYVLDDEPCVLTIRARKDSYR